MTRFADGGPSGRTIWSLDFVGQARAVAGCIALSVLLISGCAIGGTGAGAEVDGGSGGEQIADPCEPACCCRAEDNYYIRYSCSSRVQCMADGGECATAGVSKCLSDANPG